MQEYKIPLSKGLWIGSGNTAPEGYANELVNLIPTSTGLVLRKGHVQVQDSHANYIAAFGGVSYFVLFSNEKGVQLLSKEGFITLILNNKIIPVAHLETNNRLILFFNNSKPMELFLNPATNLWTLLELTIEGADGIKEKDFYFQGAVRYRERLFFYKEGSNTLYYTDPLAYKGSLKSFDVTNIFNSKGIIRFVDVLGYSAGGGVNSNLIIGFDSGDILVFDGTNPEDAERWKAVTVINVGSQLFNKTVRLGTKLLALCTEGLVDVGIAIAQDNIIDAKSICKPILEANIDYNYVDLYMYGAYLILNVTNATESFLFNTEVGAFCKITNENRIISVANMFNILYFCDDKGNIYRGFNGSDDNGNFITGRFSTNFLDFGISNNKVSKLVNVSLLNTGDTSVFCNVNINNKINSNNRIPLPSQGSGLRWSDVTPTWKEFRELFKGKGYQYSNVKVPRGGFGRSLCISFAVESKNLKEFKLYSSSLLFDVLSN